MDDAPRNILMNLYPAQSFARFDSHGDRAIIETKDGKVYTYEDSRPAGERFVEESVGLHPGMWLPRVPGITYKILPSGEYPFRDLEFHLRNLKQVYYAVSLFHISLDPEMDIKVRRECVEHVTELLDDAAVRGPAEIELMRKPLPDCIDVEHSFKSGRGFELLQKLRAKWHPEGWKNFVVSLRRGKSLTDLGVQDAKTLAECLDKLGIAILEVMPTGQTIIIRSSAVQVDAMRDTLAACHIVQHTTGHANLASMN